MGMFDYLRIDSALLPERLPDGMDTLWQTKDTPDQYLTTYEITTEGELNRLKWNRDTESYDTVEMLSDYHGDLRFYSSHPVTNEWFEFVARFTEGKLSRIWRIPESES